MRMLSHYMLEQLPWTRLMIYEVHEPNNQTLNIQNAFGYRHRKHKSYLSKLRRLMYEGQLKAGRSEDHAEKII